MSLENKIDSEYSEWLGALKLKIKSTQIRAALSANKEIIQLYWEIGKDLFENQKNKGWGNSVVDNLEKGLLKAFPNLKGFSRRNLFYMKGFYKPSFEKVQQLVAQISWGHNILIFSKSKSIEELASSLNNKIKTK